MTCTPDQKHLLAKALMHHQSQLCREADTLSGDQREDKLVEACLARRLMEKVQVSQYVNLFTEVRTA